MRESKCYISVACFHYGGSDLLRFGKFEVLITSQALLSQKQPIFMQNYNFVKNDVFVAKICKYALYESSEGLFCAPRKAANFCHPAWDPCTFDRESLSWKWAQPRGHDLGSSSSPSSWSAWWWWSGRWKGWWPWWAHDYMGGPLITGLLMPRSALTGRHGVPGAFRKGVG